MTHQPGSFHVPGIADAGAEVARLRQVLALVREIGGIAQGGAGNGLDEAAQLSGGYASALPIVQRRFDEEAAIVARWTAAGMEALLVLDEAGRPVEAAARQLAAELERALGELARIVASQTNV